MKIRVDVDCTPEEARAFLGLPDVKPMQEELMREMQERMAASIRAMEPQEMLRTWLPGTMKGFEQLQEFLQKAGAKRE
jgi:exoribonuclease R